MNAPQFVVGLMVLVCIGGRIGKDRPDAAPKFSD